MCLIKWKLNNAIKWNKIQKHKGSFGSKHLVHDTILFIKIYAHTDSDLCIWCFKNHRFYRQIGRSERQVKWSLEENTLRGFKRESRSKSFSRHRSSLKEMIRDSGHEKQSKQQDRWMKTTTNRFGSGLVIPAKAWKLYMRESNWGLNMRRLPIIHESMM